MTSSAISILHAREILDSRGRPTVEVDAVLADGSLGRASVPSGASTGAAEAHELRDRDPARYAGFGVLRAVGNVTGEIAAALRGTDGADQRLVDDRLRALDGTDNLGRLGANATLAVSLAVCRAVAVQRNQALYERIADLTRAEPVLPLPMTNIFSGGLHAGRGMDVQDFLAVPMRAQNVSEAIVALARVRAAASDVVKKGGLPTLLADEGGLSPGCETGRAALELMIEAIERSGQRPGEDIAIAVDAAATTLKQADGCYRLEREGRDLSSAAMVDMMEEWASVFPLVSIEDGLDEEDWDGWKRLTARMGPHIQIIGDDVFATNAHRVERGICEGVANAVLVKANQNGTLTGTLDVIAQAKQAGYRTIVSARSGETEDPFIADLAVGSAAGQIKIGSLRTSNTNAKYNELMRIEERSGAGYAGFDALRRPGS